MPGTGFATGNWADDIRGEEVGLVLPATAGGVGFAEAADLRAAVRFTGVGEGTATGRPGFATSEVAPPGAGSGS